jgi:2-dehydro-3-deoxyphosphogluconate aldolase / (4S)-4-hydroxy-2-oxoglutarate aldolase
VGSDLVNLAAVDAGHPEIITQAAKAYLQVIAAARLK